MDPDGIIESNWDEVTENFDDMNLREELLRGVYAYGFEKPSAIQQVTDNPLLIQRVETKFMSSLKIRKKPSAFDSFHSHLKSSTIVFTF